MWLWVLLSLLENNAVCILVLKYMAEILLDPVSYCLCLFLKANDC